MYYLYFFTLVILFYILTLLWREERRLKNSITHGMANKFWVLREKRRFVRFDKEVKIRYNVKNRPGNVTSSKTANISKKGLCILAYEKLKEKTFLEVEVDLPDNSGLIVLTGTVVWTKDLHIKDAQGRRLFYTGIKFSKINPKHEALLISYLNTLKEQIKV